MQSQRPPSPSAMSARGPEPASPMDNTRHEVSSTPRPRLHDLQRLMAQTTAPGHYFISATSHDGHHHALVSRQRNLSVVGDVARPTAAASRRVTNAHPLRIQVPMSVHNSVVVDQPSQRHSTEPASICKRCMSKRVQDGRGGSATPSRCVETRGAIVKMTGVPCNASVHAVVAVTDRRWSLSRRAVAPHGGEFWTPSTERSDRGEPVNGHIVSASRQFRTTARADLAWPTAARNRRTGPRDCAADLLCVGESAFKAPCSAQEIDCTVIGSQVAPLLEPANIRPVKDRGNPSDRHRHRRTGGPSVDPTPRTLLRPS